MHLDLPEKRYYRIGEIAKAFDVNASLIRFWDKEFEALKPKKNAKGNRRFTPEDVQNLKLIYNLVKERGYTLEGAKTYIKEAKKKPMNNFEIVEKLNEIKKILLNKKRIINYFFLIYISNGTPLKSKFSLSLFSKNRL